MKEDLTLVEQKLKIFWAPFLLGSKNNQISTRTRIERRFARSRNIRFNILSMALKAIIQDITSFNSPANTVTVEWIYTDGVNLTDPSGYQVDVHSAQSAADLKTLLAVPIISQAPSPGITSADIIWPTGSDSPVESALSLSLQTSTGAVGTQVSSTQDAWVTIAGQVSTTASIAGNAAGDIIVEVAPTNSATAGDWVEKGRIANSQAVSLALALQSVQVVKGQVAVFVPKGYYVKARTSGSGTVSYALSAVRKVLL